MAPGAPFRGRDLSLTVTLAVLASVLLHASWNALVKTGADRLMMMGWIAAAIVAAGVILLKV
jgi:hypothetical protein